MHARWAKYFQDIGVLRGYWSCRNQCCHLWDDKGQFINQAPVADNPLLPRKGRFYGMIPRSDVQLISADKTLEAPSSGTVFYSQGEAN